MRHETPLRHVLTTALAAAVLCIPAAQAANHAPPGVNFAEHWMEGGGRATLRASSERTLDDGARYRADVWDVVDADGSPGQDPHNPDNFLSGVYEAIDSGNGWVCINLTLEGQCLPTVPGNALYIGQDAQGSYAVMCLTRATPEGECLVESDEIRLDDTTEHTAPADPTFTATIAAPNFWGGGGHWSGIWQVDIVGTVNDAELCVQVREFYSKANVHELCATVGPEGWWNAGTGSARHVIADEVFCPWGEFEVRTNAGAHGWVYFISSC